MGKTKQKQLRDIKKRHKQMNGNKNKQNQRWDIKNRQKQLMGIRKLQNQTNISQLKQIMDFNLNSMKWLQKQNSQKVMKLTSHMEPKNQHTASKRSLKPMENITLQQKHTLDISKKKWRSTRDMKLKPWPPTEHNDKKDNLILKIANLIANHMME